MSEKKISRQRAWQVEMAKSGKCSICAKPVKQSALCAVHYSAHCERVRNRYRKKHGIPIDQPVRHQRPKHDPSRLSERQQSLLTALRSGVRCFWFASGGYYVRADSHQRCSASLAVLVRMGLAKAVGGGERPEYVAGGKV